MILTLAHGVHRKTEVLPTTARRPAAGRAGGRCKVTAASSAPLAGFTRTPRLCSCACSRTWDPFGRQACGRVTKPPPGKRGPTHTRYGKPASRAVAKCGPASYRWATSGSAQARYSMRRGTLRGSGPKAVAIGRDDTEPAHVGGGDVLQVLQGVVRQAKRV